MPARKKNNLSKSTAASRRKRSQRASESQAETEERLASQRQRQRIYYSDVRSRSSDGSISSQDRNYQLQIKRQRSVSATSRRDSRERVSRLEANRFPSASSVLGENSQRHEPRHNSQAFARAQEPDDDARLHQSRESIQQLRAEETEHTLTEHESPSLWEESESESQRSEPSAAAERRKIEAVETEQRREARLTDERLPQAVSRLSSSGDDESTVYDYNSTVNNYSSTVYDYDSTVYENDSTVHDLDSSVYEYDSTVYEYDSPEHDNINLLRPWNDRHMTGFRYDPRTNYAESTDIGRMTVMCRHCRACKWNGEPNGICCSAGKVLLDPLQEPPEPLKSLLLGRHPESKRFLKLIRVYNGAFQMTSFGGNEIREGHFMPCFKIQGQVYHRVGSLLPTDGVASSFLQVYFISDRQEQVDARMATTRDLDPGVVTALQDLLHRHNAYVRDFKSALESLPADGEEQFKLVINADRRPRGAHAGCYNAPACSEVAVLLVDAECGTRDIVLRTRDARLQRVCETHRAYDSLQYPLMFCRGEDGYHFLLRNRDPNTRRETEKKTSALQFYSYRIMVRDGELNYLLLFRQLFNQFLVDMYAKIEAERLLYIKTHQSRLRAENYIHLMDALRQDGAPQNIGQRVILPATFTGSPRSMHNHVQDAFVYVRKHGRPDLFVTMTTNPKWREIIDQLSPDQVSHDRHDFMSRVFHLKLKKLMDLFTKNQIFGAVRCFMFTIEWQKRGLPHAHILIWLEAKLRPNQMDSVISAELPDPQSNPALYEIVKSHMIHGPCGTINPQSPCMKNCQCSKRFPKRLTPKTITGDDGYPTYRRRSPDEGGFTASIRIRGQTVIVDNRWVVPFSPVLLRALKTHLNVEFCGSIQAIKYLCKYITKGSDHLTFAIENENDEVMRYQTGRYISTSEAVWRILSYPIHERFPPVLHLDVHLENGQRVYFDPSNVQERVENPKNTTLTAFFDLCSNDAFAKTLLYEEVPAYYTFNKQTGVFNRRRRGVSVDGHPGMFKENTLGRVFTVHPNNNECFHLRLLLHTVRGPASFADLRTVDDVEHRTFQAACAARNLLEDDQHWDHTLEEACVGQNAAQLRLLFSIMLVFCQVSDANQLWIKYRDNLAEDIAHDMRQQDPEFVLDVHRHTLDNSCLQKLQATVVSIGGLTLSEYGLPVPMPSSADATNREYAEETRYNITELSRLIASDEPRLTLAQNQIYQEILESVAHDGGKTFFLDAPSGTGKTFLINLILNKVRSEQKIALAVALSGIAATLLPGGRTAHSCFKIPLTSDLTEHPVCAISKNSDKACMIRDCVLIIWDECTMAHRKSVEAVNRTLQDIRDDDRLMGGVTFLFCGDYRQTLPVVPRGTRADEVSACLKRSSIWPQVHRLSLRQNMRAQQGSGDFFSETLLSIGNGTMPDVNGQIKLPPSLCSSTTDIRILINFVYPDMANLANKPDAWLCERAILAPRNEDVFRVNDDILDMYGAASRTYLSINTVVDRDEATNYPAEFLNSLKASGLPAHQIRIKVGAPIMPMRNLSPPKLCNGTRLRVTRLQNNIIEATILTGSGRGEQVLIPRIPLIPSNFPFQFKRLQFPVSVCFAMTINKSQGQTLETVGVDLRSACFSHGQLYVACSRARANCRLCVCASTVQDDSLYTTNVVYKEALI